MTTSIRASEVRPIPSSDGSQTLIEYLKTIEPAPMPGPKPVNILDVLVSVYDENAVPATEDSTNATAKADVDEETVGRSPGGAFKLARLATIIAITGWIILIVFFSSYSAFAFFCLEGLAMVLATSSFSYPKDCLEIRPLRILAFALSIGWVPIILLFLFGWPVIAIFLIVGFVCAMAKRIGDHIIEQESGSAIGADK